MAASRAASSDTFKVSTPSALEEIAQELQGA